MVTNKLKAGMSQRNSRTPHAPS